MTDTLAPDPAVIRPALAGHPPVSAGQPTPFPVTPARPARIAEERP